MNNEHLIFGTRAIIEAINAGKEIERIVLQKGLSNDLFNQLRNAIRGSNTPVQFVPVEKMRRITDKNHQGAIAYLTEIHYYSIEEILPEIFEEGKTPLLLLLDRITDVRNFGAIARSAECAGVHAIIIPSRGAAQVTGDAIKTSAGALHRIKVCREENLKKTIEYLKSSGLQVVACHEKTDRFIYDADYSQPTVIIMGSEENGISNEYVKRSDVQVKIPMVGNVASLNVSVAAGIILFEAVKQRVINK